MIGFQIRGIRHLYNVAKKSTNGAHILTVYNSNNTVGECFVFPTTKTETVVATFSNESYVPRGEALENVSLISPSHTEAFRKHITSNQTFVINTLGELNANGIGMIPSFNVFGKIKIALPEDFEENYEKFCSENIKTLSHIHDKY